MQTYDFPDATGHFGQYGGVFVSETLMQALDELKHNYAKYQHDPAFLAEYHDELKHFVGRPSPIYYASRLTEKAGGAKIYFKREDLNHTGAHKINNVKLCWLSAWAKNASLLKLGLASTVWPPPLSAPGTGLSASFTWAAKMSNGKLPMCTA
jgi:hypothetical protein